MIDMEQDVEPPINRPTMRELKEYFQSQDYTQFSPQAVLVRSGAAVGSEDY